MQQNTLTRRKLGAATATAAAAGGLSGCLHGEEEPADDDHDDDDQDDDHDEDHDQEAGDGVMAVETFELVDRDTGDVTNYVHGDHWDPVDGGFPAIEVGHHVSVGAFVEDEDGEELALGEDGYDLRVRVADDAEEGVVDFDFHGDHVHIEGLEVGLTDVVFQIYHDDHVEDETPPLTVQVVEEGEEGDDHHDDHDHDDGHDDDHHDDHDHDDGHDDDHHDDDDSDDGY